MHEMLSTSWTSEGRDALTQVLPPSLVLAIVPRPAREPATMQELAKVQLIASTEVSPPSEEIGDQVVPPSLELRAVVVPSSLFPTTKHIDELRQSTPTRLITPGTV
jgi:hypothetical protein